MCSSSLVHVVRALRLSCATLRPCPRAGRGGAKRRAMYHRPLPRLAAEHGGRHSSDERCSSEPQRAAAYSLMSGIAAVSIAGPGGERLAATELSARWGAGAAVPLVAVGHSRRIMDSA